MATITRQPPAYNRKHAGRDLVSKLSVPLASKYSVGRTEIIERVCNAGGIKLVLVLAPAGFGKTTTMLQLWERFEREGAACAWLNLDDADNDPWRFLSCFGPAMQRVLTPDPDDDTLVSGAVLDADELASMLRDRVGRQSRRFVMFIDEFECLHNPAVLSLIGYGIERHPPGLLLVIGSRHMPDIGLSRLRARGQLIKIGPADLRFSSEEAADFLVRKRGIAIKEEYIEELHRSTEGWAAGLWLASVALERRADVGEFIAGFGGSNSEIADYLAEDVLGSQAPDLRDFLLETSILDQLTPALCDFVCQRTDSAALIEQIERANLFLLPIGEDRSAFRYHSLFSDFLRDQLHRRNPQRISVLHRRAADFMLTGNRPIPAIHHTLASGDEAGALQLIDAHAETLLDLGRLHLLTKWLDAISPSAMAQHSRLRIIHAWAVTFTRSPQEAMRLVEDLDPSQIADPATAAQLVALRPLLLSMSDRISEGHQLGLESLPRIDRNFTFAYGMLAQGLAITHMILGKFNEAHHYADEARKTKDGNESIFRMALSETVDGFIDLVQGRLKQATVRLGIAAGVSDDGRPIISSQNAFPSVLLAEAWLDAGDNARAERILSVFTPLVRVLAVPDHLINAQVLLARIFMDRGETERGLKLLADLELTGCRLDLARVVACARIELSRHLIAEGKFEAARDQIRRSGDASYWERISQQYFVANDLSTQSIAEFRWMIRSGAAATVIPELKKHLDVAEHQQRYRRALKLRILLAEALHQSGERKAAMRLLSLAVDFGVAEGFVRPFMDEGPLLQGLLQDLAEKRQVEGAGREHASSAGLFRHLTEARPAVADTGAIAMQDALVCPLTAKEIEVLERMSRGYSNAELAESFFVSINTIRTHLHNINTKLQVTNRTQAIALARNLNLIR